MAPDIPSSRKGLAGTKRRLKNHISVVAMLQKEGISVMCMAFLTAEYWDVPASFLCRFFQLKVRKTQCEMVITKTMVARLAVRMPILMCSRCVIIKVSAQVCRQADIIPKRMRQE